MGGVMATKERTVDMRIRLPAELHKRLVASARRDRRSLNGQVQYVIERATEAMPKGAA